MIFNKHSALVGSHAFLSASKPHWIRYDEERLKRYFVTQQAAARGSRLHSIAQQLITERIKLPHNDQTLNRYVNDAISYRMSPEQLLFYSINFFGTPDAIAYSEKKRILRISDLKTGEKEASFDQLVIYSALFFLEYGDAMGITPNDVLVELRIYQNDGVKEGIADPVDIMEIMAAGIHFDTLIEQWKEEQR